MPRFKPKRLLQGGCIFLLILYGNQIYKGISKLFLKEDRFDKIFLDVPKPDDQLFSEEKIVHSTPCQTKIPTSQADLLELFKWDKHWQWIAQRVEQNWPYLKNAVKEIENAKYSLHLFNRTCLNILILPGLLTQTDFSQLAFVGGPLGELAQWADLISTLHILGHRISIRYNIRYTGYDLRALRAGENDTKGCSSEEIDLIFTDMGGHSNLPKDVQHNYRHKLRILDVYGTEVMYNDPKYAEQHHLSRSAGLRNLNIKQFWTMYPETVDNSFLGFMVHPQSKPVEKKEIAILYGKEAKYLIGKENFIMTLRKFMEIHSTMNRHPVLRNLPAIQNHGVLSPMEYKEISSSAKYFIGLGDPIEGPGILEALARGCVIVQPLFIPPRSLHSVGKPTNRSLSSQVPYLQKVGKPNVFTIDYNNPEQVQETIQEILKVQVNPMLPKEFSPEGYVHRINMYLSTQTYCTNISKDSGNTQDLRIILSETPDMSCTDVCKSKGLICDVTQFPNIKQIDMQWAGDKTQCQGNLERKEDVFAPGIQKDKCFLQGNKNLYSCASYTSDNIYRVCPCVSCDETNQHFCPHIML